MRNNFTAKLHNRRGMTILWALMFVLVAMMTIALVLTSAVTDASKVENRQEAEQGYTAAAAVLEVFKSDLIDGKAEYSATTESADFKCGQSHAIPDPASAKKEVVSTFMRDEINGWIDGTLERGEGNAVTGEVTVSTANEAVKKAYLNLKLELSMWMNTDNYNLEGTITAFNKKTNREVYKTAFVIRSSSKESSQKKTYENFCTHNSASYDAVKTTVKKKITWDKIFTYEK